MLKFKHSKKGFTLIELLVVISIIGFLSTMALVNLKNVRLKARDTVRLANIDSLTKALEFYYDDHGEYPNILSNPSFNWEDYYEEMYIMLHNGGYIGFNGNSSKFANFFVKSALAMVAVSPKIQDPLAKSLGSDWSYGYYNSVNKQSYVLRVRFEKSYSGISKKRYSGNLINNGFTGGCDNPLYFCVSSNKSFTPNPIPSGGGGSGPPLVSPFF